MRKLRLGVVGVGNIFSGIHLPAILASKDYEIVAVCDIVSEKLENPNLPKDVKKYDDYKAMIDECELDAVDIATPNYLHSDIAVYALNANLHVFTEKPDAISVSEMKKIIQAEKQSGKIFMAMRNNRYTDESVFINDFINKGEMGDVYSARCGWIRRRGIPGKGGWFTTNKESGGGPLIDLGVHMIDLAIYLMGNPKAVAVSGSTYCKFANSESESDSEHAKFGEAKSDGVFDVEDLASGYIRFDNGASLSIEFSWASNIEREDKFLELRGDKGGCKFDYKSLTMFGEQNGKLYDISPKVIVGGLAHDKNLYHFADCVLRGAKPNYSSTQGLNIINIISAIYESAKTGREVVIND